jgi:choline dehydrogenase-like flavoprotein
MLIDARELPDGALIEGDVIIAGGGMAGIALARQLGDAGLDVVILESGGLAADQRTQALYQGKTTLSLPDGASKDLGAYLLESRVRRFGGSGNAWGGKCAPLDPIDFEKRDWIPHSGWPVTREQMQPFYDRACGTLALLGFGKTAQSVTGIPDPLLGARSESFTLRPRRYSATTGMLGDAYEEFKRAAAEHRRVKVYLHANASHVHVGTEGEKVERLDVLELNGRRHSARAHIYVLALGGIENARLLLASNGTHRRGIGNHSDWLGCAFQLHTVISRDAGASLSLHRPQNELELFDNTKRDRPHVVIGTSDAAQRKHTLVNFTATLTQAASDDPPPSPAVATLAARLCAAAASSPRGVYFMIEHTPNRASRLALVPDDRDELGMPRVRLDARYNEVEIDSFDRSVRMLAVELGRLEAGRVQWRARSEELLSLMGGPSRHHMGATRMARSPAAGVVDEHCRVHHLANLYVAGSSVFPTSGIANPTLTLLALTHRLGDHLVQTMRPVHAAI